ncbi:hypothetical protein, partial [Bacillus wiedmannii]|uniref:hypothetical protein n=1 Tax=Bacillus wiedmannii TaxID=1890302 RepID=UPI001C3EB4AE
IGKGTFPSTFPYKNIIYKHKKVVEKSRILMFFLYFLVVNVSFSCYHLNQIIDGNKNESISFP